MIKIIRRVGMYKNRLVVNVRVDTSWVPFFKNEENWIPFTRATPSGFQLRQITPQDSLIIKILNTRRLVGYRAIESHRILNELLYIDRYTVTQNLSYSDKRRKLLPP